ncbi:PNK3P-domain-containing protein [Rhizodiscina lignyota]|uniref:PNK3P-domain-containing protein n=1 Tax=Rhizodiscina lignyota TaxID=1504668 RepID=A0A9P4IM01_9PEZI|nr:PNK3P-domain-containing protein [Rhizodiscina lignyota]
MAPNMKRGSTDDGTVSPPPLKRGKQSTVTQKAVANFFTPASKKEKVPEKVTWRIANDSLVVGTFKPPEVSETREDKRRKIAGFDFDSTLISTSSGNVFGKDAQDWKWWDGIVPKKLRSLYEDGYYVVIFSNQSGISLKSDKKTTNVDKKRFADFKTKTAAVFEDLNIPISIYAATAKDMYRKPRTGMWNEFLQEHELDPSSDLVLEHCIFVGDAGGRAEGSQGKRKDFSCSDRDFAFNIGIPYMTPEEFFLGTEAQPFMREFDPSTYLGADQAASTDSTPLVFSKANELDLVLLCGSPGAGKSTFYWNHLKPLGYERVNQDNLKTRERCLKVAEAFLKEGSSVVVDNTNPDEHTRKAWVNVAKKLNVPIRCVLFTAGAKLGEHNDAVRALNDLKTNPENRAMLPRMAFNSFTSRFRDPSLEEGFQDITKVDFKFEGSEEQKEVWRRFWL